MTETTSPEYGSEGLETYVVKGRLFYTFCALTRMVAHTLARPDQGGRTFLRCSFGSLPPGGRKNSDFRSPLDPEEQGEEPGR